jgi:CheY-like chemotaxis protein
MPKMDGFECLDLIKSINPLNNIPIFIYSTSVNPAHLALTYEKGASMFFQKPTTFEGIRKLVRRIFTLSRDSYFPQTAWEDYLVKAPEYIE